MTDHPIKDRIPETIPALFRQRVAADGPKPAIAFRSAAGQPPQWKTWDEFAADVRRAAVALDRLGVWAKDTVVMLSENRYEWLVVDLAIHLLRAIHVPAHAPLTGPQVAYQIKDCGAKLVIVSGLEQARKLEDELKKMGPLPLVSFDRCDIPIAGRPIPLLSELGQQVSEAEGKAFEQRALFETRSDDLATILYTSGTTGEPKGVMLTHRNLVSNAIGVLDAFEVTADDLRLCWLPLSHIFARTCDFYAWIAAGARLALAVSRETVLADCAEFRPTLLNGVPYFWDKALRHHLETGDTSDPEGLSKLFGGRVRILCSGGAALPDHVAQAYREHGVLLVQGYGLTESSPVITFSTEAANKLGTVGRPMKGLEVRIAEDGEILSRGPHIMAGYWNKPRETRETVRDGWLYTGDLGEIDADGYVKITGRKKELIVTASGKNIAPVLIESMLTEDPLMLQALVIGDARNYLTALIVVNAEPLKAELKKQNFVPEDPSAWLRDPRVIELYQKRIDSRLVTLAPYEQVRRFTLLEQPFTIERDEMTPTLKLRRKIITGHYSEIIEAMYAKA